MGTGNNLSHMPFRAVEDDATTEARRAEAERRTPYVLGGIAVFIVAAAIVIGVMVHRKDKADKAYLQQQQQQQQHM